MNYNRHYDSYKSLVNEQLHDIVRGGSPRSLYDPTEHVLQGGGKRVRAVLVMLACEAAGRNGMEALKAGLAVEILHNFTLVHDDIMDRADTRRGRATVHARWDEGTAILVGDVMIGIAQKLLLENAGERCPEILRAFAQGIIDVCEGQALDREFERRNDVSPDEYLRMIAMKTGRLVEMAAEIGGMIGGGTPEQIDGLRAYARNIGLAFQIQDDLLDLIADQDELGKQIGKDIIEGKRTYLVVQAIRKELDENERNLLNRLLEGPGLPAEEIGAVRALFERHGILDEARADVERYCAEAAAPLERLPDLPARGMLEWFAEMLMRRNS